MAKPNLSRLGLRLPKRNPQAVASYLRPPVDSLAGLTRRTECGWFSFFLNLFLHTTDQWKCGGPEEDDFGLADRVLGGDRRAFEVLIRRHERRVFRVTWAVPGNFEDAEEAMQDAFVKDYRNLGQFRRESRFTTWLTRIAVNEALKKRESRKDHVSLDESCEADRAFMPRRTESWRADPEKLYGKQELRRMVETAIQGLPAI
jgi:RNA polymerase sigma factor (sigma-70 family)